MSIHIPARGDPWDSTWETLLRLQRRQSTGWTLIGAQMVALHGLEHARTPPRRSEDADVLANVRTMQDATRRLARILLEEGFEMDLPNLDGLSHRFRSGRVSIDLLAPDRLGERSDLSTIPPAHTLPVPGGTQALRRTELVDVTIGPHQGQIPRPSLLGALIIKARAVEVDDTPENQREDLAFLLSLVSNPRHLREQLTSNDLQALRAREELLDPRHSAWLTLEGAEDGRRTLSVLVDDR